MEFNFLKDYFRVNSFPEKMVNNQIRKFINNVFDKKEKLITVPKKVIYLRFPYFGYINDNIKKDLLPLLNKKFGHIDFKIAFKSTNTIGGFFKHKETLSEELTSSVIYKYCCELCNNSYIGCSKLQLERRADQYLGISFRTNLPLGSTVYSSIRNHGEAKNHKINKSQFRIIDKAFYEKDLRILESIHIFKEKPSLNETASSYPLSIIN